ncbi:MAG TPA: flagellar motor protein MotB [Verrucomicrobiae bacterium]|jgi:chemotaxis protein MotB|nr:flagellar motor protein MotB [Verrucomicrobiae bacterium]
MSKKKGHHGGAWKVAYADFVTAMMALFMVMWLSSQDQRIKEAVERAFRNPFSSVTKESVGIIPTKEMQAIKSSSGNFDSASAVELAMLRRLNQDLMKSLQTETENPADSSVKLELLPDGLRVNVFDRAHKPIFEPQSTKLTAYGDWVFSTLAWEISRYTSFTIQLEGHTEKGNPPIRPDYGDWEISADRATAIRRELIEHGVRSEQIKKVAGFGDTVPMPDTDPTNEINRRVTVLLNVKNSSSTL